MKKIDASELKRGDVIWIGSGVRVVLKMSVAGEIVFAHFDGDIMENIDPRTHYKNRDVYIVTNLREIEEIIKESLKNE